ncbi:recombinase family protein [Allopontixanthobacter sp.]|uniref:recombinase family protein n=1 Tax=Allopontixanthobacter sp. TaxID=2906452 RepID=UPI002AB9BCF0|nr:recombinase family protein [Allopontixanthobacter sp.]MDZ4307180.1 recombinase family protein [Allopontixanthobacter sp.]
MTDYVAYLRVSTVKQGRSGLGREAQEAAINAFLRVGDRLLQPPYEEIESGKRDDRPELVKALNRCKLTGATLLVAKLDRLSRNVAFIATLQEAGTKFVAADMPEANELTIHIMAAMAQHERKAISRRTKDALAAAKARGTKLGGWREYREDHPLYGQPRQPVDHTLGTAAKQDKARAFNTSVRQAISEIQSSGTTSLSQIAQALNEQGVRTRRGGRWQATQVDRVMQATDNVVEVNAR